MPEQEVRTATPEAYFDVACVPPVLPSLWDDLPAIREYAARAAIVGTPLEAVQRDYTERFEAAWGQLDQRVKLQVGASDLEAKELQDEIQRFQEQRAEHETSKIASTTKVAEQRLLLAEHQADVQGTTRLVQAGRSGFRFKHERDEDTHRRERQSQELQHRIALARLRVATATEDRKQNQRSAETKERDLLESLEATSTVLDEVRTHNHIQQQRGLTRPVSRFLVWASFFSFAGIGIVLAQLFLKRIPPSAAGQRTALQIREMLGGNQQSLLSLFLSYSVVLILMAGVVIASVTLLLLLLKWMRWTGPVKRRQTSPIEEMNNWMSFFQLSSPVLAKRLQSIDVRMLYQVLMSVPIAIGMGMLGFLWIIAATPVSPTTSSDRSIELLYVGALYAVMTASSGLLFWLFVLRPAHADESTARPARLFYTALFVLPLFALLVDAAIPDSANEPAVAVIATALVAATIGLGHGIYLKGLFLREEYLTRECTRLRDAIAECIEEPTAEKYINPTFFEEVEDSVPVLEERRVPLRKRWWHLRRTATSEAEQATQDVVRRLLEEIHAPAEMIERLNAAMRAHAITTVQLANAQEELAVVAQAAAACRAAVQEREERLVRVQRYRLSVLDYHTVAMLELVASYRRVRAATEDAYRLAELFSNNAAPAPSTDVSLLTEKASIVGAP